MKNHLWFPALLVALTPSPSQALDMMLDVSPLRVHLQVKPGAEYTDAVSVTNTGSNPVRLRAYLSDWTLDEAGTPIFSKIGTEERSSSRWVDLAPADFLLEPGEIENVRFTIHVPEGVSEAGYHSALILENVPLDRSTIRTSRVFVQGRVACMLYVTVGNPPRSMKITSMSAGTRATGPYVDLVVENTGKAVLRLAGGVRLVVNDNEDGDIVELPDVPVLPGGSRRLLLDMPTRPTIGETLARVNIDLGEIGVLFGECPLEVDRVASTQP
ncbi:hypothetical protein ACFL6M_02825 [Candidatus Eisenbacteria bacterium]|uniref:Pili assembly chaperone N-terminal domain-containing protein n=1 Tax=Eiseniibacteriota bacterium TaxID=2212470 RepID=A0ABV6YJK1_UNCEI